MAEQNKKSHTSCLPKEAMTLVTHLVIDLSSLKVRSPGPAIAGVWLTFGEAALPSQGWTDFVVVILGWWADALLKILKDKTLHAIVHFMDGPFMVEVSMAESGRLSFKMLDDSAGSRVVAAGGAPLKQFLAEVAEQSRLVLKECESRKWWSTDADFLAERVEYMYRELDGLV